MVYDSFAGCLDMAPYHNRFLKKSVRNYQNCSELFKNDPFVGELPNEIWRGKKGRSAWQFSSTSTPCRLRPEGSVATDEGKRVIFDLCSLDKTKNEPGNTCCRMLHVMQVLKCFCHIWCRFAYVCITICPNYRWYVAVVENFQNWLILPPCFDEPDWNFQKTAGCFANSSFKGRAPTSTMMSQNCVIWRHQ